MTTIPALADLLASKPLYYKEIDHERIHVAYGMLRSHIKHPPAIHVIGTNGKGSTGRMIAHLAYWEQFRHSRPDPESSCRSEGSLNQVQDDEETTHLSVGHYTSPHILRFNERIWLDGADASDEVLEAAHQRLYGILGKEISDGLSYFEYTTLLALVVFERCDLIVLEAGLGGEYDATNVVENKVLTVVTPIGIDHQAFLGDSINEIAHTKINSIHKKVLLAPQPYWETVVTAREIAWMKYAELFELEQKSYHHKFEKIAKEKDWPDYLLQNAAVAARALEILDTPYNTDDLKDLELFGRFYPLTRNIRIDVGHNPLAAHAIVEAMEPDTVLVYNSLDDKDYEEVLRTLKPKIKRVEIIRIDSQRAATLQAIEEALENVGLAYSYFEGEIDPHEHYLIFGSFYVVEEFLTLSVEGLGDPESSSG
jgi:dihydrofolate synthase/folylpolyglutamate synthase